MKKAFVYILIILIGAVGVYFALTRINQKKEKQPEKLNQQQGDNKPEEKVPSRDDFINEATKLQLLAENKNCADTCHCYTVKELDPNSKLSGSILVYTSGDIFLSNMWLSNGYYIIDNSEVVTSGLVQESSERASNYCGESSPGIKSSLCVTD